MLSTTKAGPEALAVFQRLRAIKRDRLFLDKGAVEEALRQHLDASGLPPRPVLWMADGATAYQALRERHFALDPMWEEIEFRSLLIPREPLFQQWTNPADQRGSVLGPWATFQAAQSAMSFPEVLVHREAARETLEERAPRSYLRGASLCAVLAAAWLPHLRKFRPIWRPLIGACEAGLWAFSVLPTEILAVPRPIIRSDDDGHRLHCENGPAVEWPEGSPWWMLENMRVEPHVVQHPDKISIQEILNQEHAAVRRLLVRRMGMGRFLGTYGARPFQEDRFGALLRVRFVDDDPLVVVKVKNATPEVDGSHRTYFLQVPDYMRSAREAVAWTFGMSAREYRPLMET